MKTAFLSLLTTALIATTALPVAAAETGMSNQIGVFSRWTAYSFTEQGKPVCFMSAEPTKSLPAGAKRGEIYAMITHRPADMSRGVVSVVIGYPFKKDSDLTVTVGKQSFQLMTDGDTAWTRDEQTDTALATAIKNGDSMVVTGESARGTKTTDTFSLAGATAALAAIDKACPAK